jgi:hypothetical protein
MVLFSTSERLAQYLVLFAKRGLHGTYPSSVADWPTALIGMAT